MVGCLLFVSVSGLCSWFLTLFVAITQRVKAAEGNQTYSGRIDAKNNHLCREYKSSAFLLCHLDQDVTPPHQGAPRKGTGCARATRMSQKWTFEADFVFHPISATYSGRQPYIIRDTFAVQLLPTKCFPSSQLLYLTPSASNIQFYQRHLTSNIGVIIKRNYNYHVDICNIASMKIA